MISADLDALQVRYCCGRGDWTQREGLWEGTELLHPTGPLQTVGAGAGSAVFGAGWRGEEGSGTAVSGQMMQSSLSSYVSKKKKKIKKPKKRTELQSRVP